MSRRSRRRTTLTRTARSRSSATRCKRKALRCPRPDEALRNRPADAEGERPRRSKAASKDQEQDCIRIPCEEPSGQRRAERSDAEDTQEREAEGQPAKRPRHFSGDERILKWLEGEEEKAEHQGGGDEGAFGREDCQEDEKRSGRHGQREQEPVRLTALDQTTRQDL